MRYREGETDEDVARTRLRQLADDVEPRPDALPRLLAATRRRRFRLGRPLIVAAGMAVVATGIIMVTLVLPGQQPPRTQPASVGPNSYVAQRQPGVIAAFDVSSGRQLHEFAGVPGQSTDALAAGSGRVYALVSSGGRREIVEMASNGAKQVLRVLSDKPERPVLAAGAGRVAYTDGASVVVIGDHADLRLPVPSGARVRDLAVGSDGKLAVLTEPEAQGSRGAHREIHTVEPGASTMTEGPPIAAGSACGPVAITWSGTDIAALRPAGCGSSKMRIAVLDSASGDEIGAGAPFDIGSQPLEAGVGLSTDRVGRFLVSASDSRQWLVDGSDIRTVPPACSPGGPCAGIPATFVG